MEVYGDLQTSKRLHNHGKPPILLGNLTILMAIFNSYATNYIKLREGNGYCDMSQTYSN